MVSVKWSSLIFIFSFFQGLELSYQRLAFFLDLHSCRFWWVLPCEVKHLGWCPAWDPQWLSSYQSPWGTGHQMEPLSCSSPTTSLHNSTYQLLYYLSHLSSFSMPEIIISLYFSVLQTKNFILTSGAIHAGWYIFPFSWKLNFASAMLTLATSSSSDTQSIWGKREKLLAKFCEH